MDLKNKKKKNLNAIKHISNGLGKQPKKKSVKSVTDHSKTPSQKQQNKNKK